MFIKSVILIIIVVLTSTLYANETVDIVVREYNNCKDDACRTSIIEHWLLLAKATESVARVILARNEWREIAIKLAREMNAKIRTVVKDHPDDGRIQDPALIRAMLKVQTYQSIEFPPSNLLDFIIDPFNKQRDSDLLLIEAKFANYKRDDAFLDEVRLEFVMKCKQLAEEYELDGVAEIIRWLNSRELE